MLFLSQSYSKGPVDLSTLRNVRDGSKIIYYEISVFTSWSMSIDYYV
jgi:hypothetical protein